LGLSIVRELAKLLGGDVKLSSELGKGSKFTLWLPIVLKGQPRPLAEVLARPFDLEQFRKGDRALAATAADAGTTA
jgi:hypothetical protein